MAAKRRHRKSRNPHRRHASRRHGLSVRRNPQIMGRSPSQLATIVVGLIAGGIGSSVIPNSVLPTYDTGAIGYLLDIATAIGGAMALDRFAKSPNLAQGWLFGGLTMTAGRIFDDYFNKQVVTFSLPTGTSSYYRGDSFTLPRAAILPRQLMAPSAPPSAAQAMPSARIVGKGVGWAPGFYRRLAA